MNVRCARPLHILPLRTQVEVLQVGRTSSLYRVALHRSDGNQSADVLHPPQLQRRTFQEELRYHARWLSRMLPLASISSQTCYVAPAQEAYLQKHVCDIPGYNHHGMEFNHSFVPCSTATSSFEKYFCANFISRVSLASASTSIPMPLSVDTATPTTPRVCVKLNRIGDGASPHTSSGFP